MSGRQMSQSSHHGRVKGVIKAGKFRPAAININNNEEIIRVTTRPPPDKDIGQRPGREGEDWVHCGRRI